MFVCVISYLVSGIVRVMCACMSCLDIAASCHGQWLPQVSGRGHSNYCGQQDIPLVVSGVERYVYFSLQVVWG